MGGLTFSSSLEEPLWEIKFTFEDGPRFFFLAVEVGANPAAGSLV